MQETLSSASRAGVFVEFDDVSKVFGQTKAVRNVSLDLAIRGKIHALVGENGAGKSTCLGMAAGRIAPSSGSVRVEGAELSGGSPRESKSLGIHAIYQELTVLPALTPRANVFLGQPVSSGGWLKEREMQKAYEQLCARIGVTPSRAQRSGDLSIADQQMLEILRALASEAECILFDEPTASLAQAEREALFRTMAELKKEDIAMVIVGHNLDEIMEHSDLITVFRDGGVVETRDTADWSKSEMVHAMLGEHGHGADIAAGQNQTRKRASKKGSEPNRPVLEVRNLSVPGVLHDISFDLQQGEVLGIAGLVGSGRTELLRALSGLDRHAEGYLKTNFGPGESVPRSATVARKRGISLLPEDRKGQGLLLVQNATENIVLGEWRNALGSFFVNNAKLEARAADAAGPVGYDVTRMRETAGHLSGGNQQKLMIARWLYTEYPILLADEPTRGVDVGAKAEILEVLEGVVDSGRSMIVVSSDIPEVIGLSDRVLVLHEGRIVATLDSAERNITPDVILQYIFETAESGPNSGGTHHD